MLASKNRGVFRKLPFLRAHLNIYVTEPESSKESELIQLNSDYLSSSRVEFEITEYEIAQFNCIFIRIKLRKHEKHSLKYIKYAH